LENEWIFKNCVHVPLQSFCFQLISNSRDLLFTKCCCTHRQPIVSLNLCDQIAAIEGNFRHKNLTRKLGGSADAALHRYVSASYLCWQSLKLSPSLSSSPFMFALLTICTRIGVSSPSRASKP